MQTDDLSRRAFLGSLGAAAATARSWQADTPLPSGGSITDVAGVRVGHFTHQARPTGCTVVLFDTPPRAGADYAGSAPGESLGVMLQPVSPVDRIHGILLTGGGPLSLGATAGVVRFLEEHRVGYDWGVPNVRIPIVVGAVIDDLAIGDGRVRIGPEEAYRACQVAAAAPVAEGSVGAGAGATVGKLFVRRGLAGMKGGIGTASVRLGDLIVGALVVLNCAGDVIDWRRGTIVAGARTADGHRFARTVDLLKQELSAPRRAQAPLADEPLRATTLTVVATNAALTKTQLTKLAIVAHTGASRAINPYQTESDGDQVVAVSTGSLEPAPSLTALGAATAEVVADTIVRAALSATALPGWSAARDL